MAVKFTTVYRNNKTGKLVCTFSEMRNAKRGAGYIGYYGVSAEPGAKVGPLLSCSIAKFLENYSEVKDD